MKENATHKFTVEGKKVTVFAATEGGPCVCLNTVMGEGARVYRAVRDMGCDFSLVEVSGLNWDHDMAPWDAPPISKGDTPCTGGADAYLRLLTDVIMPQAQKHIHGCPWVGLAGYSLAGLFAVYAAYRTTAFSRIASMSGSLWFPGFKEYVLSHDMARKPDCMYFSLGDKECKTRNVYLKVVQERTEEIEAFCKGQGIDTVFRLNPGNHYKDAVERTAAGIGWLLSR